MEQHEQNVSILLVDDHPANLLALEAVLRDLGHELVHAHSGREALRHLLQKDFALVVLDVQMQEMDGFETAGLMRARERSRLTPIIFLTGINKGDTDIYRGYQLGAVDYIFKPFTAEVLRAKVQVFVELYRKTLQIQEQTRRLQALNTELLRSNAELDAFASIASHDLQEPLRKIIAFGDRLKVQMGEALAEDSADSLARMQSAAQRMRRLIEALLTYSRVSARLRPLEPVVLGEIVQEVLVDLEVRTAHSGAKIEVGPLDTVLADRVQMQELFQNLVGNALKFARKDEPLTVTIGTRRLEDGTVEIEVEDNGIGFDEKYLDRIFKPFQRLHGQQEYEGTGMGLAIVAKIVQRHSGTVTAHSAPGQGARFVVTLPGEPATDQTKQQVQEESHAEPIR